MLQRVRLVAAPAPAPGRVLPALLPRPAPGLKAGLLPSPASRTTVVLPPRPPLGDCQIEMRTNLSEAFTMTGEGPY